MLLHPFQRQSLVKKSNVEISIGPNLLACKKPPRGDTVIEIDKYDLMTRSCHNGWSVVVSIVVSSVASALNVDPDGKFRFRCSRRWSPNIDKQTILAMRGRWIFSTTPETNRSKLGLLVIITKYASRTDCGCVLYFWSFHWFCWFPVSQISYRRSGIADTQVLVHSIF